MATATRRMEFDAAHRITRHGSKCWNLHGHRYVVELTCATPFLNDLDMVIDFGVMKSIVGAWIDAHLDHGVLLKDDDHALISLCEANGWKTLVLSYEPTAESLASMILQLSQKLLRHENVEPTLVRVYETPNCWADATPDTDQLFWSGHLWFPT